MHPHLFCNERSACINEGLPLCIFGCCCSRGLSLLQVLCSKQTINERPMLGFGAVQHLLECIAAGPHCCGLFCNVLTAVWCVLNCMEV